MNLYIKISKVELNQYNKEFLDCITHNSKNSYIKNIFIYTNCKEYRCSINNIKLIYKEKLDDFFIISDSKFTKGSIIYSNPFIKFGEDLFKISENELNKYILVNKDYKIYLNDIKITKSQNEVKFINKEEKSIRLSHINMGIISFTNDSESIIKKPTVSTTPTKRSKKLDVIIVSVDYNDLLILTLQKNRKIFHNITVVTSKTDQKCKEICDKFGVSCIQTDIMYDNNSTFNKGKAINVGINSIENPDLILLLDADIIVENDINLHDLNDKYLYTSERIILPNYDSYLDYINNGVYNKLERDQGLGFYQLFSINNNSINRNNPYPDNSSDASWSDLVFRDKFEFKKNIDRVIHLGDIAKNWSGRKTEEFISDDDINLILERYEEVITILYPPTINWYLLFQRPQQLMKNFAQIEGVSSIFWNPRGEKENKKKIESLSTRLHIVDQFVKIEDFEYLFEGKKIFWFSHPSHHYLSNLLNWDLIIFDAIDNPVDEFSEWATELNEAVKKSDIIFASAKIMYEDHKKSGKPVYMLPNGSDFEIFEKSKNKLEKPEDFPKIDGQVIGYYGAMASWLDWKMVEKI